MAHHDAVGWLLGAAIVLGIALFVALVPPWRIRSAYTADSLQSVRRAFVLLGLLLAAGTAVVLANTPVELAPPPRPRSSADSLHYLTRLVDTAGASWHLQALGAIAWRRGDTTTSHWAIRRLMHLDCRSGVRLLGDRRYHDLLVGDTAIQGLVHLGCRTRD
jgi:hypothetical protein